MHEFQDQAGRLSEIHDQIEVALKNLQSHRKKILALKGYRVEADGSETKISEETKAGEKSSE